MEGRERVPHSTALVEPHQLPPFPLHRPACPKILSLGQQRAFCTLKKKSKNGRILLWVNISM